MASLSISSRKRFLSRYVRKYSQARTIANNSNSFLLFFPPALLGKREANAVGVQTQGSISWQAPNAL